MAIFATDNKFNILDDPNAGFLKKTPKKPKIWGYFFWIGLALLFLILLWGFFTAHAEAALWQQQANGLSRTLPVAAGQSNFNLGQINATTTIKSIQVRALFSGVYWQNKNMKICVYSMTQGTEPYPQRWYVDNLIGCESRTIGPAEIDTEQDFNFSGADIYLPPGDIKYGFLLVESGYENDPLSWSASPNYYRLYYTQSENGTAYGGAYDGYIETTGLAGSRYLQVGLYNVPDYWTDALFIISGLEIPPSVPPGMINCEGGGFFDTLLCNLYVALFLPSDTALNQFSDLWNNIKNKPPFGYFTIINSAISGLAVGTTTLAFAGISDISIFGTLRLVLMTLLWFLFAFWIFHRLRNFNF
jgi:hypothetical protein